MFRKVPHESSTTATGSSFFFWSRPCYEHLLAGRATASRHVDRAAAFTSPPPDTKRSSPLRSSATARAVAASWAADKGQSIVVGPSDGESFWQAAPAGGYIQYKVDPLHFASNRFLAGVQILPPGGMIPPHAHTRNEKILLIANGSGEFCIDGVWHRAARGSLAFVSRWVTHSIRNTGNADMSIFFVFTPPGPEQPLRAMSRPVLPAT